MLTPAQTAERKGAHREPWWIAHPNMPHTCENGPVVAAMAFPDAPAARAALARARTHMRTHAFCAEETLIITREPGGNLAPWPARGFFWAGLVGGAIWGGVLGGLFFQPVIGTLAGATSGALAGWLGIPRPDAHYLRQLVDLPPGHTAVLFAARHAFDADTLALVCGPEGMLLEDGTAPPTAQAHRHG